MPTARSDETRRRLLEAATLVFAEKGFEKASTREIASRAKANIGSIHYHFGDKAALYRAVFAEHFNAEQQLDERLAGSLEPFEVVYRELHLRFLAAICGSSFSRIMAREQFEPTGLLGNRVIRELRRRHGLLVDAICRKLGVEKPDAEIQRLTFALIGMIVLFDHGRPLVEALAPELLKGKRWAETMVARLAPYAEAVIEAERTRRAADRSGNKPAKPDSAR